MQTNIIFVILFFSTYIDSLLLVPLDISVALKEKKEYHSLIVILLSSQLEILELWSEINGCSDSILEYRV